MYLYSENATSDTLMHYGVLGMKWGVRRTPEQLGRRTIPKGTKMYRATVNANESLTGNKYVTYLPPDRDMYRGSYATELKRISGKRKDDPLYENEYELKIDLKVPSRKEVKEVIQSLKEKDKQNELAIENGKAFCKSFIHENSWEAYEMVGSLYGEKGKPYPKTGKEFKEALSEVHEGIVKGFVERYKNIPVDDLFIEITRSFGPSEKNRTRVINELKKRGYNAMVDEAGVGSNSMVREGVDPLIIFDGESALTKTKTVEVDKKTQSKADKEHEKWYRTANRNKGKGDW